MHVALPLTLTPSVGGPELLEKSTVPNTASSHTHATTATRRGASTYSSMNTRDRNTLNHHIKKWVYIIYYSSSTVCTNTKVWLFYVVWTLLYFPQVYIIIALWLHIFSKLVSLVVFRCTETLSGVRADPA